MPHLVKFFLNHRALFCMAIVITLFTGIAFQGSRGIYETTEGRYAESARETLASQNVLEPMLNQHHHWTKPPLTYLAIMSGMTTFGQNTWGARAYLVLSWLIIVLSIGWSARMLWNKNTGAIAAVMAATCPMFVATSNIISTDILLTAFVSVAIAAFFHCWHRRENKMLFVLACALGLGVLTKGPVALLVPFSIMLIAWPMYKKVKPWQPSSSAIIFSVMFFLFISLSWFVFEAIKHPGLMNYWLGKEVAARFTSNEFHRNEAFSYVFKVYLPILFAGTGLWLPIALWKMLPWQLLMAKLKQIKQQPLAYATMLSLVSGVVISLIVLSLSKSKLPLYLTPIFIPINILLARILESFVNSLKVSWKLIFWIAIGTASVMIPAKFYASRVESEKDMTSLAQQLEQHFQTHNTPENLYSISNGQLNGLEFHLNRIIAPIKASEVEALIEKQKNRQEHTVFLIRPKDFERYKSKLPTSAQIVSLNGFWLALEWPTSE